MEYDDSDENILYHSSDDENVPSFRRPRIFKARINFDITDFKERFRMTSNQVSVLVDRIGRFLEHKTRRNFALSPRQQVLIALRFYADGGSFRLIGDAHGISRATVSRCLRRVTRVINRDIFHSAVDFPLEDGERLALPITFKNVGNSDLPSVCACIDGTHIPILAPSENESQFVNRHDVHSLNCMLVCGPNLKIFYASCRWPGSVHDSRVLRNSNLFERFESGWRPFPNAIILGDSGYPLTNWLITPVSVPRSDAESAYNVHHKRIRRLIENCIGILKQRFRCLRYLHLDPVNAGEVVKACCCLHNLILDYRSEHISLPEAVDEIPNDEHLEEEGTESGHQRRSDLIARFAH